MAMRFHDFCYWLQGAIEIGALRKVTQTKVDLILKRLQEVEEVNYFTVACHAILKHYPLDMGFAAVSDELQKIFEHVVDPTYEGDQQYFYDVHQGTVAPR